MGILVKCLIGLAVIVTAYQLTYGYSYSQPNFHITLELETSEGRKTASSVVKVRTYGSQRIPLQGGNWIETSYDVSGYAPMIDIDPHGWVLVQLNQFLGAAIVRAYKKTLSEIAQERPQGAKSIDVSLRLIGPDGNWGFVTTISGGKSSEILTDKGSGWTELRRHSRSNVSVVDIKAEITSDPVLERNPDPPEWLRGLRRQATEGPSRQDAASRLVYFETGAR